MPIGRECRYKTERNAFSVNKSQTYLLLINLLLQDFSGVPLGYAAWLVQECLKHSFLGIAHLVLSPRLCSHDVYGNHNSNAGNGR